MFTKNFILILLFLLSTKFSYSQVQKKFYEGWFQSAFYEPFVVKDEFLGDLVGLKNISTGKTVLKAVYDDIVEINGKYVLVIKDNKRGVVDTTGRVIIPIIYLSASNIKQGRLFLANSTGKFALADANGKLLTKYIFDDYTLDFKDGMTAVQKDNLWGYINKQGVIIIPIKYYKLSSPRGGRIRVTTKTYQKVTIGTISEMNKPLTRRPGEITFDMVKNYVIDYKNNVIFKSKDDIHIFDNGYIMTLSNSSDCLPEEGLSELKNFELYDKNLKKIIAYKACWQGLTTENFVLIKNGTTGKFGIVKMDGSNFTTTNYTKVDHELHYDEDKNYYLKLYKDNKAFVYINKYGDSVEADDIPSE